MLYDLGGVTFEVAGLNADKVSRSRETSFAKYDVLGTGALYEHTGEADRKIEISGKVYPYHLGGLGALEALESIRSAGQPVLLMRGDGTMIGWVLIETIKEEDAYLQWRGDPGEISHTISMCRCDAPGVGDLANLLFSLF
jgi:phage protein U